MKKSILNIILALALASSVLSIGSLSADASERIVIRGERIEREIRDGANSREVQFQLHLHSLATQQRIDAEVFVYFDGERAAQRAITSANQMDPVGTIRVTFPTPESQAIVRIVLQGDFEIVNARTNFAGTGGSGPFNAQISSDGVFTIGLGSDGAGLGLSWWFAPTADSAALPEPQPPATPPSESRPWVFIDGEVRDRNGQRVTGAVITATVDGVLQEIYHSYRSPGFVSWSGTLPSAESRIVVSILPPDNFEVENSSYIYDYKLANRPNRGLPSNITSNADGTFTMFGFEGREMGVILRWQLSQVSGGVQAPPALPIFVTIGGSPLSFDVPPKTVDGRTLVPLRAIFEALGAEVNWDDATQTITGTKEGTTVVLPLGSTTPTVNGQTVTIDVPGMVQNGRTLVPLRFVAESFGVEVNWDGATRTVTINSN
ncbi:MAG: copper amine oxidase N-terminal domain-containing protein [Oscillospiraceae bacterium]|nr:copper amine oxidase N-terminal domain-containing protein [Oscillospiraceae bacterium]